LDLITADATMIPASGPVRAMEYIQDTVTSAEKLPKELGQLDDEALHGALRPPWAGVPAAVHGERKRVLEDALLDLTYFLEGFGAWKRRCRSVVDA
jgi:hypothetical protein